MAGSTPLVPRPRAQVADGAPPYRGAIVPVRTTAIHMAAARSTSATTIPWRRVTRLLRVGDVSPRSTLLRSPDDDTTVTMGVKVGGRDRGSADGPGREIVDSGGELATDGASRSPLGTPAPGSRAASVLAPTVAAGARNRLHAWKSLDRQ
jgi:hypothetical protein